MGKKLKKNDKQAEQDLGQGSLCGPEMDPGRTTGEEPSGLSCEVSICAPTASRPGTSDSGHRDASLSNMQVLCLFLLEISTALYHKWTNLSGRKSAQPQLNSTPSTKWI